MTRKLSPEQVTAAIGDYQAGRGTIKEVAVRYGICYASLHGLLKRRGLIETESQGVRLLRVRRRHGEALAALVGGEVDDLASGPRHVALSVGAVAVELLDAGWDDHLHRTRLRQRLGGLGAGRGLLTVWLDRDHRLSQPEAARHVRAFAAGMDPGRFAEYRTVWGDGPVIGAGRADEVWPVLTPPTFRPIHV